MTRQNQLSAADEKARLAALEELAILDTAPEQAFDDLTKLAAFICGTPVSLVSLVSVDRQFFKSAHNISLTETPRDQSFCAHTLATAQTLIVEDTTQDERFTHHPLVTGAPRIRFYAGAPLFDEHRRVLGTLCVIDHHPRQLTAMQIEALEALARQATELLHQRRLVRQHEKVNQELQKTSLLLGLAGEAGQLGIVSWYLETDTTVWENDYLYEIFGRTREQGPLSAAAFIEEAVFPADRQSFIDAAAQVRAEGDRLRWTGRFFHTNGQLRWIEVLGYAERDAGKRLVLVGTIGDITERKLTQIKSEEATQRLQIALEGSNAFSFDWNPDRDEIVWGGIAPFGRPASEVGNAVQTFELVHPDDQAALTEALSNAVSPGDRYACTFRAFWPDGSIHWVRAAGQMLQSEVGSERHLLGVNQDITEMKLMEQELQFEQERLQIALRTSKATTFDWLPDTDLVTWTGLPPFGVDPARIPTGASSFEYVHPDDREGLAAALLSAREHGQEYSYEYRGRWSDGSFRWVRTAGKATRDVQGRIRFLGVNTDVTDRKLTEEALLHTEKLAAVGRLASVISHEINNPLEAVTNLLYIVRMSGSLTQEDKEHLELADRELARVGSITAQTLRFHRTTARPEKIEASAILNDLVTLYQSRLTASHIAVEREFDGVVTFHAFEGDIRQVLNNLVSNAFDAMRKGGRLRIRARYRTDWLTGVHGVVLTVADSGRGIDPEARKHLFQAFHSTKGIHGSGLGLWISKRIVEKHKGRLDYRSRTGAKHGTVFRLWLPAQIATTAGEPWA